MPARFVLEPETEGREGSGGEPAGSGGDFHPKIEFSVEDDLFRGISGTGSAVVPSCERESLLLECEWPSFPELVLSVLELAFDLRRNSLRNEGMAVVVGCGDTMRRCERWLYTDLSDIFSFAANRRVS